MCSCVWSNERAPWCSCSCWSHWAYCGWALPWCWRARCASLHWQHFPLYPGKIQCQWISGWNILTCFLLLSYKSFILLFDLQANSEVSALLGRIPSAVGYQPTLATDLGGLQERITTTKKGSITSVQAIYVPADDLTDPAPATTFAHLDATTVLSRQVWLCLLEVG